MHSSDRSIRLYIIILLLSIGSVVTQLVVNVKNGGGDVYKQSINANTSLDTVTLKFEEYDGTQITQFIDFRNVIPSFYLLFLSLYAIYFTEFTEL